MDLIGPVAAEVLTAFDQPNSTAATAGDLPALTAQEGEPFPKHDCRRRPLGSGAGLDVLGAPARRSGLHHDEVRKP
jgi:hypothetical protein